MKKNKMITKILLGLVAATPVTATIVACGADNPPDTPSPDLTKELNDALNWINNLSWNFSNKEEMLTKEKYNRDWFLSQAAGTPLNDFPFRDITVTIPSQELILYPKMGMVKVTYQLSNGVSSPKISAQKALVGWKNETVFNGDLSKTDIYNSFLVGINVAQISVWPTNLSGVDWTGVVGLTAESTPFKGDISEFLETGENNPNSKTVTGSKLNGVDVSQVTKWPTDLTGVDWTGVKGLTSVNTPFRGDISETGVNVKTITSSKLNGVDVSQVTKWPLDLSGVDWTGVIDLASIQGEKNPFSGDISKRNITGSKLTGVDVSDVTEDKWPKDLSGIDWTGVVNLGPNTGESTPFTGSIDGNNFTINNNILNGVDVSKVTNWPIKLVGINWTGVKNLEGLEGDKNPFDGDKGGENITGNILNGIDVGGVNRWPTDLSGIDWTGVVNLGKGLGNENPFKDNISTTRIITNSKLKGVNVREVTTWPVDLTDIDWTGVVGLTAGNTPFKNDITTKTITGTKLNGVDVSQVTKWPTELSGMDWTGVLHLPTTKTDANPFSGNMSESGENSRNITITNSKLKSVNVREVTTWPDQLTDIDWTGVVGLTAGNTPFKNDITTKTITGSKLNGVDVSRVTKWPLNLSGIDWTGVNFGMEPEKITPFKDDLSLYDLSNSKLKGIDLSQISKWPVNEKGLINLVGINWLDVIWDEPIIL